MTKTQDIVAKKHKIRNILCFLSVVAFSYNKDGGSRGIRTPVGLRPNGFQDRLVMTASICFRIKLS